MNALAIVDHLLLGTSDLDRGIDWFQRQTGVMAAIGGSHPGRGTRNALAALGGPHYLEIIAPDPAQPPENLKMNLRWLDEPRLITWAAATDDIEALASRLRGQGRAGATPVDGSRGRPDGSVLTWRTLAVATDLATPEVNPIPFFIEWGPGSAHPSQDAPEGCELAALEFAHPEPAQLDAMLSGLGIDAIVRHSTEVTMMATLTARTGRVVLR
jgi:hypothetical protein